MAKKEKVNLVTQLRQWLDGIVLVVMLALCGGVVYLYMNEGNVGYLDIPQPQAGALDEVAEIKQNIDTVNRIFSQQAKPITDSGQEFNTLLSDSLFEAAAADTAGASRYADRNRQRLVTSAQTLLAAGKHDDAIAVCDYLLSDDPTDAEIRNLKSEIAKRKLEQPTATPMMSAASVAPPQEEEPME